MGFPSSKAVGVAEVMGAPARALDAVRARLDAPPVPIRFRLEVQWDGGGRRGLERAARRLGLDPADLLERARDQVDPDMPIDVLPEVYP